MNKIYYIVSKFFYDRFLIQISFFLSYRAIHLHLFIFVLIIIISIFNLCPSFKFPLWIIHRILNFWLQSIKIYIYKLFFVSVFHYLNSIFYIIKLLIIWTSLVCFSIFKLINRFLKYCFLWNTRLLCFKFSGFRKRLIIVFF